MNGNIMILLTILIIVGSNLLFIYLKKRNPIVCYLTYGVGLFIVVLWLIRNPIIMKIPDFYLQILGVFVIAPFLQQLIWLSFKFTGLLERR
jgi:hypothetical protein